MSKNCSHATCQGETCRREKKQKKVYKIRPFSKKRAKENRKYSVLSKKFIEENPLCMINSPVCIGIAQGVNHTKGRGNNELMDVSTWEPSCNPCNGYCESHDKWARDNGHKISRHAAKVG